MHDVGVGDRENHPRLVLSEPSIQCVLQVDHVGPAIGAVLRVHAMIGGEHDGGSKLVEPRKIAVQHRVELVGHLCAGRSLVLNVVRRREIHEVGALALHQLDSRDKDEFRQCRAVHRGEWHPDPVEHVFYAVFRESDLIGFLGGKANPPHPMAEKLA